MIKLYIAFLLLFCSALRAQISIFGLSPHQMAFNILKKNRFDHSPLTYSNLAAIWSPNQETPFNIGLSFSQYTEEFESAESISLTVGGIFAWKESNIHFVFNQDLGWANSKILVRPPYPRTNTTKDQNAVLARWSFGPALKLEDKWTVGYLLSFGTLRRLGTLMTDQKRSSQFFYYNLMIIYHIL
jgi:hypothetical protein